MGQIWRLRSLFREADNVETSIQVLLNAIFCFFRKYRVTQSIQIYLQVWGPQFQDSCFLNCTLNGILVLETNSGKMVWRNTNEMYLIFVAMAVSVDKLRFSPSPWAARGLPLWRGLEALHRILDPRSGEIRSGGGSDFWENPPMNEPQCYTHT